MEELFFKLQNGGLIQDGVIFEKKSTFLRKGPATVNSIFSKNLKRQSGGQRPKMYQN
jgi:hypothetical protein